MDIEVRLAKVEVEVETNNAAIEKLGRTVEELRASTELRTEIRWLMGICLGGFVSVLGLLGRIGGLY